MSDLHPRWEQGSDFHLSEFSESGDPELPAGADLYASGRDALRAIIAYGVGQYGWKVLWVPSYFCQTVLHDIRIGGIELRAYADGPLDSSDSPVDVEAVDPAVILTLNPFGLRVVNRPIRRLSSNLWVIEDHTHDPWSPAALNSTADYALASLRKTIPIPDGGLLWSPKGLALPSCPRPSPARSAASLTRLAGMTLKRLYLAGASDDKNGARNLLVAGENGFNGFGISGMPSHTRGLLNNFPARSWREKRGQNFRRLSGALKDVSGISVLRPNDEAAVPFSVFVQTTVTRHRDDLRNRLLSNRVYPAILWRLDRPEVPGIREEDIDLSEGMLSIHCDARYGFDDMDKVAEIVRVAMGEILAGAD